MAPLRSKLNHTLHKLNDKIKRHSGRTSNPPQDGDGAPQKHQNRTLPTGGSLLLPLDQTYAATSLSINMVTGLPDDPMCFTSGTASTMPWNQDEDTGHGVGLPPVTGSSGALLNSYNQPSVAYGQFLETPMQSTAALTAGSIGNPIGTSQYICLCYAT